MKILFDTNVISNDASYLLSKVDSSEIMGFLCAAT